MTGAEAATTSPPSRARPRASLNAAAVRLSAAALSFILIALLVVTSSRAAFTATTDNTGNQAASSGTLELSDNDASAAMFSNVTGLVPGEPVERCITVTYTGNIDPVPVRLYAPSAPTGDLAAYLDLRVEVGPATGAAFPSCAGFAPSAAVYPGPGTLAGFSSAHSSYAIGLSTWDPAAAGDSRTFRFHLEVQDVEAAKAKSSTFGFAWETRSG